MQTPAEIERNGERIAAELVPTAMISGDDHTDTTLLGGMAEDAKRYIASFSWCEAVRDSYFGGGVGGIFAVFFFHILPSQSEVDPWIWVMIGNIPPAYLPVSDADSPAEASRTYMQGMRKWVELARKGVMGTDELGVPPVNVPATPEWAENLNQRLYGLSQTVESLFEKDRDGFDAMQ